MSLKININTNVNGNNNTAVNNQDNSVRQYGGDNRSLVINEANTGNQSGSGSKVAITTLLIKQLRWELLVVL